MSLAWKVELAVKASLSMTHAGFPNQKRTRLFLDDLVEFLDDLQTMSDSLWELKHFEAPVKQIVL